MENVFREKKNYVDSQMFSSKKKKSTFYILFSFNFLKCSHKLILESYGFVNAHS